MTRTFTDILDKCWRQDGGAVTVDWVVLTAGLAMAGLALIPPVRSGVASAADTLQANLVADGPTFIEAR